MIIVNLVGGLGNQLFQVAAAKAIANPNEQIILEYGLGTTRLLDTGLPEINAFSFSKELKFSKREGKLAFFIARLIGFTLRKQNNGSESSIKKIVSLVTLGLCNGILCLYYRRRIALICPPDLGFTNINRTRNLFLSGYFQSYHWPQIVREFLNKDPVESDALEHYRNLARIELPIVIHIRRGDYKKEDTFGLLGANYYRKALAYLEILGISNTVWLFSDEPELALKVLQLDPTMNLRVIPELDINSAQLLEVMKLGRAFVIANSTFSWWAAFLSEAERVVAPKTWFKRADAPSRLIPESWHLVDSSFE